jgi:hypothetical protein
VTRLSETDLTTVIHHAAVDVTQMIFKRENLQIVEFLHDALAQRAEAKALTKEEKPPEQNLSLENQ